MQAPGDVGQGVPLSLARQTDKVPLTTKNWLWVLHLGRPWGQGRVRAWIPRTPPPVLHLPRAGTFYHDVDRIVALQPGHAGHSCLACVRPGIAVGDRAQRVHRARAQPVLPLQGGARLGPGLDLQPHLGAGPCYAKCLMCSPPEPGASQCEALLHPAPDVLHPRANCISGPGPCYTQRLGHSLPDPAAPHG